MKIRTKLFVAFAAGLVFQLVHLLATEHYIGRMTGAARTLDNAVTVSEASRKATDCLQQARESLVMLPEAEKKLESLEVSRVYIDELWLQLDAMSKTPWLCVVCLSLKTWSQSNAAK